MIRLTGEAAEARLAEAWATIHGASSVTQQIVHVLRPPTRHPAWLDEDWCYTDWVARDYEPAEETWKGFAYVASSWPYTRDARRARAALIPNIRVCVLERARWESAPPWLQFIAEVHLPATAVVAGEALYRVWREDCREAGLPDRDYDVNIWGAAGVMLTGYGSSYGDVAWRAFLENGQDGYREERDFALSARDLALERGELIRLPAAVRQVLEAEREAAENA
jgi:hypothetical protein